MLTLQTDPSRRVLGIMVKEPKPGRVKTRLAAESSEAWAAQVAHACLLETLSRVRQVAAQRWIIYAPSTAKDVFSNLAGADYRCVAQTEGDLGSRMASFCRDRFQEAATAIVILGTDSPNLPIHWIQHAFERLDHVDVVLGPSTDGGYYLLGISSMPPIFADMPWSQPTVLEKTVQRLQQHSHTLDVLSPWYDVDTLADWQMLRGHLAAQRCAGTAPELPYLNTMLSLENHPTDDLKAGSPSAPEGQGSTPADDHA